MAKIHLHAMIRMVRKREKERGLRWGHKHVDLDLIIGANAPFCRKPFFFFYFLFAMTLVID
jgi:hypothetical protein